MNILPLVALAAGAAYLLRVRGSPPVRSGIGSSNAGAILARFRATFAAVPSPLPPPVLALRVARESAGRTDAIARGKVVGGHEVGITQVYVPTDPSSRTGARGADADPLDPLGAVWATQWVAEQTRRMLMRDLPSWGKDVPADSDLKRWIALLEAEHSIGYGAIRSIMKRHTSTRDVLEAFRREAADPRAIGRMSARKVGARISRVLTLHDSAAALEPLPDAIRPLPPRPPTVPRFNAARLRAAGLGDVA